VVDCMLGPQIGAVTAGAGKIGYQGGKVDIVRCPLVLRDRPDGRFLLGAITCRPATRMIRLRVLLWSAGWMTGSSKFVAPQRKLRT